MSTEKMKEIKINANTWSRLKDIQKQLGFRKWSATIDWLLNHQSLQGETVQEAQGLDPEKIPGDLGVDEKTQHQIHKIQIDHNFNDFSGVMHHLLDCHSLLEQEAAHEKLASRDSIDEIRNHIEKLKPLRKIEKKHVVEVLPTVDISSPISEDQNHTDDTIEKQDWLICPICWRGIPILVKDPSQKPERGFVFKEVDSRFERRFLGVNEKYMPLEVRRGDEVVIEESMAISTLRRLDKNLFDDFVNTLRNVTHIFTGGVW